LVFFLFFLNMQALALPRAPPAAPFSRWLSLLVGIPGEFVTLAAFWLWHVVAPCRSLKRWCPRGALLAVAAVHVSSTMAPNKARCAEPLAGRKLCGVLAIFAVAAVHADADQPGCSPACNLDFNCTTVPLGVAFSGDLVISCARTRPLSRCLPRRQL
jgi:hypothetical protein